MKNKKLNQTLLSVCALSLAFSCSEGGSGGGGGSASGPAPVLQSETEPKGMYVANLKPMNMGISGGFSGRVYGAAVFHRNEDRVNLTVRAINTAPSVIHSQYIFTGGRCPTLQDDSNNDGYIDAVEALAVVGKVIIPLDADINSQYSMIGTFPVADAWGSYTYNETTSWQRMVKDLRGEDQNPNDFVTKLGPDEAFPLAGKVVLLNGTSQTQDIPTTVQTRNRLPVWSTVPVACGVFEKVSEQPEGQVDPEDVTIATVPVGSSTGGTSGADDGAVDRYNGGHVGTGGTTGSTTGGTGTGPTNEETGTRTGELPTETAGGAGSGSSTSSTTTEGGSSSAGTSTSGTSTSSTGSSSESSSEPEPSTEASSTSVESALL